VTFSARDVDVLVVGGGPVGLSMALQLGRAGIETLLVERRATVSTHPKAFGIHGRTMEIFRQWGIATDVRRRGIPAERTQGVGWFTRLSGHELGRIMFADEGGPIEDGAVEVDPGPSPEPPCFCPQPIYERVLLDAVRREPHVTLRFEREARDISPSEDAVEDGVEVTVQRVDGDGVERIRAQYVVAADGVASTLRTALGIDESGTPAFGHSVNVYFRADLEPYARGKPFALLWIVNPDTQGTLAPASADFTMWTYNFAGEPGVVYGHDVLVDRVREAVGDPQVEVAVLDVLRWDYDQAVADRWRVGRVFLVGDAAHRFPPHGGFGMNSGIQDAHNLAWKLVEVMRGRAGDALLDTYEAERKPIAEYNGSQALHNTHSLKDTGWHMPDPAELSVIELPVEGRDIRARLAAAVPRQREHFRSEGQQYGAVYQSDAVVDDGSVAEISTVTDYRATGHPGARAPHVWLTRPSGPLASTVDLWDAGFVLLTNDSGVQWDAAARAVTAALGVGLSVHRIGPEADLREATGSWTGVYGVSPGGAVLVRPDGHVGARFSDPPEDATAQLDSAVRQILQTR
jgi:putative polyketide hydroxylase